MKSQTSVVIKAANPNPAPAVTKGMPSIPAPIVVPAIKREDLKIRNNLSVLYI